MMDHIETHQHFMILDLNGLHDLIVMAPVQEIEELQDTYFDTQHEDPQEMVAQVCWCLWFSQLAGVKL